MRSENFIPKFEELDEDAVADFLARGGKIQYGKLHKPRKAEKWQGSSHIGAAGGKGSKGSVSGMAANTNPKGAKPVVSVEEQDIREGVPTTHEDPLVLVKKGKSYWTHANLSVANNIHGTDVSAEEIHSGRPAVRGDLTFTKSMHHDTEVEKNSQQGMAEGNAEDAAKKIQTPAYQRKAKGGDWKTTTQDLEKAKEVNVSGPEGLAAVKKKAGIAEEGVAEGLDDVRKRRLYDLIELYRDATDPSDYYDRDIEDPDEIIAMIGKEFGSKIADQVATGSYKMHFPRHGIQRSDPLGWKKPVDRITKAGKMYKQDSDYMKNTIKSRYKLSGKSATEDVEQGVAEGVRMLGSLGSDEARSAKIFRDTEWNEYVVRFYDQGEYNEEADYHTDDKQDAVDTAKSWIAKGQMSEAEKIAAHRPGWMLRMDPKLGAKFKEIEKRKEMMHKYAGKTADEISRMAAKELKESAVKSIVTGLVRVQDIVEDRSAHGLISTRERNLIKLIVLESLNSGIDYHDALIGLVEFLKQREEPIEEVGVVTPNQPTTGANTAPAGTTATSAGQPAAKPITSQGIDALAQMLKSAGLSPQQLGQVMSKAKE